MSIDTDCYGECYGVGCAWCVLAGDNDEADDDEVAALVAAQEKGT